MKEKLTQKKSQYLLSSFAIAVASTVMLQGYYTTQAHAETANFRTNLQQKKTTVQIARLLDRSHYLNQRLNEKMGRKILQMYFDNLDTNHSLLLQSDIDEFTKKYGNNFAKQLKRGNLKAGAEIFERYRQRANEYYNFAEKFLKSKPNLYNDKTVIIDHEKQPRFATKAEQEDYWQRRLTSQLIAITLGQEEEKAKEKVFLANPDITRGQDLIRNDKRTPEEILLKRLKRSQGQLNRIKDNEIMETILDTAMLTYDPHSNYYAPIQATEMNIQKNLQLEGIGVSIRPDRKNPDYTRIVTLVEGGPAQKSGQIKANDLILGVAQEGEPMKDVIGWSTREIAGVIRGKRGTTVTIKVKQPNKSDASARLVRIVRDVIKQEEVGVHHRIVNVDYKGENKRIGVLEIPSFYLNYRARSNGQEDYRSVSIDTKMALEDLKEQGIDGLVVDLRNNPGGSLTEVVDMLKMFIKEGPIVQIKDNFGRVIIYADDDGGEQLYQGDMAVIINQASASASEIFAAAIQDYGRGLVVGNTTTGKGSAQQELTSLELGQATLTQSKFYRITGGSTQNKGVIPDVELVNIYEGSDFDERSQKNPLKWDTIKSYPFKAEGKYSPKLLKSLNEQSKYRQKSEPQFTYLTTLNKIRDMEDDEKPVSLNIDKRRQRNKNIENLTLKAENTRRQATGEEPFANWDVYQADIDAKFEERSLMKENERPPLPEDEAYVVETAKLMLEAEAK